MMPKNIKGILFDFDGVLVKSMEDNFNAWKKAVSPFGINISRRDYFPLEGMSVVGIAKKFCKENNINISSYKEIVKKKEENYIKNHSFRLYWGVEEFIDMLKSKSILIGVVTAALYNRLVKSVPKDFLNKWDVIVSGDKISRGKPFPDSYLKGLSELNLNSDECIAIENAPLGIQSAKKAGIYCIAICSTLDRSYLEQADEIINEFKDLNKLNIIKSIINN